MSQDVQQCRSAWLNTVAAVLCSEFESITFRLPGKQPHDWATMDTGVKRKLHKRCAAITPMTTMGTVDLVYYDN